MAITWVLVVHGNAGRLLELNKNDKKIVVKKLFSHPSINKKGHEVYSGAPGRTFARRGPTRHAMQSENLVDHAHKAFAKEIVAYLTKEHLDHKFDRLVLVASPALLGDLRKEASKSLAETITHELSKDLMNPEINDEELIERIKGDLNVLTLF